MSNQSYVPQSYPVIDPAGVQALQATLQGQRAANQSTVFGIIGLFIAPFVFGPLALVKANQAKRLGVSSTTGIVLGWIDIAAIVLWVVILVALFSQGASS